MKMMIEHLSNKWKDHKVADLMWSNEEFNDLPKMWYLILYSTNYSTALSVLHTIDGT